MKENYKYLFYFAGVWFISFVYRFQFSFRYYTTSLLIQYALFTMAATYVFNQRHSIKQAVCLAFLTVFLNSYYWEIILHIVDYIAVFPNYYANLNVFLPQLWRLYPILFFHSRFKFREGWDRVLMFGVGVSTVLAGLYLTYWPHLNTYFWMVNCVVCLMLLVKVIMEADKV